METEAEGGGVLPQTREFQSLQKLEEAKMIPALEALEEAWSWQHGDFEFLFSKTMREQISIVLNHRVCGPLLWQWEETETISPPPPSTLCTPYCRMFPRDELDVIFAFRSSGYTNVFFSQRKS